MGSPSQSNHALPNTNRLVNHLIAAKRSLSATSQVYRANEIVAHARECLEQIAVLNAKNTFLQSGVERHLNLARKARSGLERVNAAGKDDFQNVIRNLDEAHGRMDQTLSLLKTTIVEKSLRGPAVPATARTATSPKGAQTGAHPASVTGSQSSGEGGPEDGGPDITARPPTPTSRSVRGSSRDGAATSPDLFGPTQSIPSTQAAEAGVGVEHHNTSQAPCLYDFVSEQGVGEIVEYLQGRINATQMAQAAFEDSNARFDGELRAIAALIPTASQAAAGGDDAMVALFQSLEAHATDAAEALQSLVRHYDLCVTALKHTEGGGQAAAERAQVDIDAGSGVRSPDPMAADGGNPSLAISLTQEEREEMLAVLDKDAGEVEEVVQEINDHVGEMESHLHAVAERVERARGANARLRRAIAALDALARRLPVFVAAGAECSEQWRRERESISLRSTDLDAAHDFYEAFLNAYDHMILEVARRAATRSRVERVAAEAMQKMQKLHDDDVVSRQLFHDKHGEFLPQDLWPGVLNAPAQYRLVADHDDDYIPHISRRATQKVLDRRGNDT